MMDRNTGIEVTKLGIRAATVVGSFAILHGGVKAVTKGVGGILRGCILIAEVVLGVSISDGMGRMTDQLVDDAIRTYDRCNSTTIIE